MQYWTNPDKIDQLLFNTSTVMNTKQTIDNGFFKKFLPEFICNQAKHQYNRGNIIRSFFVQSMFVIFFSF